MSLCASSLAAPSAAKKHTQSPMVTGGSIVAIKYEGGVMIATDTVASYGKMMRFTDVKRVHEVTKGVLVAGGGELSDYQYILDLLEELQIEEYCTDDGASITAGETLSYLSRVLYNRRNKFNPLWNDLIVAGMEGGKPVLGVVDQLGTSYKDDLLATGFGGHMATPILRKHYKEGLSESEARTILENCMRVLYYRDCLAHNTIRIAKVTAEGAAISEPYVVDSKWDFKSFVDPKAGSDFGGSW